MRLATQIGWEQPVLSEFYLARCLQKFDFFALQGYRCTDHRKPISLNKRVERGGLIEFVRQLLRCCRIACTCEGRVRPSFAHRGLGASFPLRQSVARNPRMYWLPRLAMEPSRTAALAVRSQISRATAGVSRAFGAWPISFKVSWMRWSLMRLRNIRSPSRAPQWTATVYFSSAPRACRPSRKSTWHLR
jgi:hypothetical protein